MTRFLGYGAASILFFFSLYLMCHLVWAAGQLIPPLTPPEQTVNPPIEQTVQPEIFIPLGEPDNMEDVLLRYMDE